jgi:hypothetical protein
MLTIACSSLLWNQGRLVGETLEKEGFIKYLLVPLTYFSFFSSVCKDVSVHVLLLYPSRH